MNKTLLSFSLKTRINEKFKKSIKNYALSQTSGRN